MDGLRDDEPEASPPRRIDGGRTERQRRIAELAGRQKGNVTRRQLLAAGMGAGAIDRWLKSGRLFAKHRGVYRLGHEAVPEFSDEMAAILACGDGAMISHRSAAELWRLLPRRSQPTPVSILVVGRNPGAKPGIRIHRTRAVGPGETRTIDRIPVTSPARTILDLAAEESSGTVERALHEGQVLRLLRPSELAPLLARHPRHRGTATLRALAGSRDEPPVTRSEAERAFMALIRVAKLPTPMTNVRVGRHEVDFVWTNRRLIVEVDGFRFHSSRVAFERDRARDADLAALGYTVIRVTWRQITQHSHALVARIAQALAVSRVRL